MTQSTILTSMLMCPFGAAPAPMVVLPVTRAIVMMGPPATMLDFVPMMNIMPFAMCSSMANPQVAAATAAALGVLTPQPCIPMTVAPWVPPVPTTILSIAPATSYTALAMCIWGGVIKQIVPGEFTTMMPI